MAVPSGSTTFAMAKVGNRNKAGATTAMQIVRGKGMRFSMFYSRIIELRAGMLRELPSTLEPVSKSVY